MSEDAPSANPTAAAAETWLEEHGDYLFRYALSRVFDRATAQDLVQETLLTAMDRADSFRGDSSPRTWLTGILRFKLLDLYRRRQREIALEDLQESTEFVTDWFDAEGHWNREHHDAGMAWEPDPSECLTQKEFWAALQQCLSHLPQRSAAAFIQRELEFKEADAIVDHLGVSESNLWVLLHRARNQLRKCLQANWIDKQHPEQTEGGHR